MILRFRSKQGTFRVSVDDNDMFSTAVNSVLAKIDCDISSLYISNRPNDKGSPAQELIDQTISSLNLKNGDMLYANYEERDSGISDVQTGTASISISNSRTTAVPTVSSTSSSVKQNELAVDKLLDSQDGLIPRSKSSMCRHGDKGMCEFCSPLPPWDKEYKEKNGIKHLSFYAYLKEINENKNNKNNATSYMSPLDNPSYKVNKNCPSGHLPYPKGICSKCQPPVITLQQQSFRMVDHVEFSDSQVLNRFIDSWRLSGTQRFGYLYGSYEPFDQVPLGIKAKVEFIYEPPQACELDGITLIPWENEEAIDALAAELNLYKVGVIFTDLTDSGLKNGSVLCKRHKDSYFLTNIEVAMAARNQLKYAYSTKYSNDRKFSSRFVTCVVSGGLNGEIEPRSYQVSVNAEALLEADIVTTSTQPSMMYINESNDTRYVPDVFYSKINEYGLEVKTNAKPAFPVDYLLVTLSDAMPKEPKPFFTSNSFVIEHRDFLGELQNLKALFNHLNNDIGDGSVLLDFHLLAYLLSTHILQEHEEKLLVQFVKERTQDAYLKLVESPGWMSLITILEQGS
ncbi:nuclear protein localization protein 4 [Yamadazyma tenuis]|uniref:Nuclear protein localization protein 4 n=1 Tax=Candida tenuis (strain ATCC 10573 / BCRC 21748 / CBS 615 / JCM 9827 / NBRC 10315 / NRRL Y-1498 / VKM Y-70) TaxID=590646 RepID=G3AYS4_CANTC|nr:polyubiquitin-tagged protein recognition complex, Npl4 component [Yamadazyma tenuis ATCC 10573]EGV65918.1 polyubiquitin-tagged protein recognition complex, Npl4 component [Yamadazyma tenuis ATCC 10573]WEJ95751.1 nuclear protein localization protein 4 [Yamadazyma tenuis]